MPKGLDGHGGVRIVPPAIDPLSPKNMALSPDDASFVCNQFGIDVDRPMICQVSRFDPWKDPIGVIDAYRLVTKELPEVQLALVGSMATDDPEGWEFFQRTFEYADSDPDIKILNNLNNVGAIEVNAFQSQSDVVLQKSIREGFGLTVTEALWKGAADDRRGRRRHSAADRRRRGRLPGRHAGAGGRALHRDPPGPGARPAARPRRQGAHPGALPHAAPAARLAADLHLARQLDADGRDHLGPVRGGRHAVGGEGRRGGVPEARVPPGSWRSTLVPRSAASAPRADHATTRGRTWRGASWSPCQLPPKRIGRFSPRSWSMGALDDAKGVVLLRPDRGRGPRDRIA